MKQLKVIITTVFLATVLIVSAQPPQGQGRNNNKAQCTKEKNYGQKHDRMGEMLNLSDVQKEKIKALRLEHKKKTLPIRNEIGENKARLRTLTTTEPIDRDAVNKIVDEIGALRTKMAKEKVNHRLDVRAELNENQRIIFDTHKPMGDKKGKNGYGKF